MKTWQIKELEELEGWNQFVNQLISKDISKNKKQLIEMAENGEPRPQKRKHVLGMALVNYTCKRNFDPAFNKKIRELAPQWFIDTVAENKKQLIEMAKNGKPRPSKRIHVLGERLCYYVKTDPIFNKKIIKLAPQWFNDTVIENKKQLIKMAKKGESKPICKKHQLGECLREYMRKTRLSYDVIFDQQIREVAPHWFINTATENKKQLIEIAKNGESRPNQKTHVLGKNLCRYTNELEDSYDPVFNKKIRKLAPQWFINTATENKKQLIEMAKNREPRPVCKKTKLGDLLCNYVNKHGSSYDFKFDRKIRELAPHWFKN